MHTNRKQMMIKQVEALYQANRTANTEELAKLLKVSTGMRLAECREWVTAWVMA